MSLLHRVHLQLSHKQNMIKPRMVSGWVGVRVCVVCVCLCVCLVYLEEVEERL